MTDSPTSLAARRRAAWRAVRRRMEDGKEKHSPLKIKQKRHWDIFKLLIALFGVFIRLIGLYPRGVRNALDIRLRHVELPFANLPPAFDGYTILQLSDLHVDFLQGPLESALALVDGVPVDLCVLTGDYRRRVSGPHAQIEPHIRQIAAGIDAADGILAILGNHDCADMAGTFETNGIQMLINETKTVRRGDSVLHITGTDDVHYYYTDDAAIALDSTPDGFKIALIHSAELAEAADAADFDLYLSGHTHAGQVALPGGHPIITHMFSHRRYAVGEWRCGNMTGYTSSGLGVSGLPVRFNTRGEIALITLRRV